MSTGIAKKKEYSAEVFLGKPKSRAVMIVIADLEIPGMSARH